MRIAILCREYCSSAIEVAEYFEHKNLPITLFVVEQGIRTKYSKAERDYHQAHDRFTLYLFYRNKIKLVPGIFMLIEQLWAKLPINLRILWMPLKPYFFRRNHVLRFAKRKQIPYKTVQKHSTLETKIILEQNHIDYALLTSSAWLIKEPLLSMQTTKIINAHYAKLPEHRSLDALQWSIIENDVTGLTAHFVDAGVDTGPILLFLEVPLQTNDDLVCLRQRIIQKKPEIFYRVVCGLQDGTIKPVPQSSDLGTHHRPMTFHELVQTDYLLRQKTNTLS